MKVVSTEWLDFKKRVLEMAQIFEKDADKFYFPIENEDDFVIYVDEKKVIPIFVKKENFLKLEYDFTFCDTRIKRLSFSKSYETIRFEMAIKENRNG